ncbi:MAG TPA: hypothetical protein VIF14_14290 [Alphaproteobacteria bacterium]|jgi:hypothetical protein
MSFLSGIWVRIAAAGAILAGLAFFLARVFKAGGDAARAKSAQAALDHQTETGTHVRQSDEAIGDPSSPRARRVRRQFERDAGP